MRKRNGSSFGRNGPSPREPVGGFLHPTDRSGCPVSRSRTSSILKIVSLPLPRRPLTIGKFPCGATVPWSAVASSRDSRINPEIEYVVGAASVLIRRRSGRKARRRDSRIVIGFALISRAIRPQTIGFRGVRSVRKRDCYCSDGGVFVRIAGNPVVARSAAAPRGAGPFWNCAPKSDYWTTTAKQGRDRGGGSGPPPNFFSNVEQIGNYKTYV